MIGRQTLLQTCILHPRPWSGAGDHGNDSVAAGGALGNEVVRDNVGDRPEHHPHSQMTNHGRRPRRGSGTRMTASHHT